MTLKEALLNSGVKISKISGHEGVFLCTLPPNLLISAFNQILEEHLAHATYDPSDDGYTVYSNKQFVSKCEKRPKIEGKITFMYPKRRKRSEL